MARLGWALVAALAAAPSAVAAQHGDHGAPAHDGHGRRGPLGLPMSRDGSGTAWQPDATPVYAAHREVGELRLMLHGATSAGWDHQGGPRGDGQVLFTSWVMGMAEHPLAGGEVGLRLMLSAEPFTFEGRGYPLLLQTGETYRGEAIHDRQHPHDLFMEVAARFRREVGVGVGVDLYVAPAGEPALGPVAYPHRASALSDPMAPLGHHWQDATHITYGVVTAGVFTRAVKLEGSAFHGTEPDEARLGFDLGPLDSGSARLSTCPHATLCAQLSLGRLYAREGHHAGAVARRVTASVTHVAPRAGGSWASTVAWGRNLEASHASDALLLESRLDLDVRHAVFGRAEWVRKTAAELVVEAPAHELFGVGALSLGYAYALGSYGGVVPSVGGRGTVNVVPPALEGAYGGTAPLAAIAFVQLRPAALPPAE